MEKLAFGRFEFFATFGILVNKIIDSFINFLATRDALVAAVSTTPLRVVKVPFYKI